MKPAALRVIGGAFKGRRLARPTWDGLRPTSARLRETVFNVLAPRLAGARWIDACAGTGAIGIEALSRGASHVTFIEPDRRATALVMANLGHCGIDQGYTMCPRAVADAAGRLPPGGADIIYLDPPYGTDDLEAMMLALAPRMAPGGVLVVAHARRRVVPERCGPAVRVRTLASGDSALSFFERREHQPRQEDVDHMEPTPGRVAIYPGSFDPLTLGHVDIIARGARLFDRIVVAILTNPGKTPLFSVDDRLAIIRETFAGTPNVTADAFDGLLIDYARRQHASAIVRGLRAVSDFEYEMQLAMMNRHLAHDVETVFMMPAAQFSFVSSRLVKEVFTFGGEITGLVPPAVEARLLARRSGEKG